MPPSTSDNARPPRRERAENAARRRRQMIEATLRSVARNGLAATTLATVSQEAGLSQGVAVFYFESKQRLLAEALRFHYEAYRLTWQSRLDRVSGDAMDRLIELVAADFDPAVFNPQALAVWHAYWGQATAKPIYAEIAGEFDSERGAAVREACADLLAGRRNAPDPEAVATGIDGLTDGLWLRAYLAPRWPETAAMLHPVCTFLATLFPEHAARIEAGLGPGGAGNPDKARGQE